MSTSVPTQADKTLLTIKDLCARWSTSPRTIHRLKDAGELPPHIRLGQQIRFPIDGVIDFEKGAKQ